jgi:segregation and condensation protein B
MIEHLKEIIESLIFISQDPLTPDRIQSVLEDAAAEDIRKAIDELVLSYDSPERGIRIIQTGGGIVADSDPQAEWEETITKARALLAGINSVQRTHAIINAR